MYVLCVRHKALIAVRQLSPTGAGAWRGRSCGICARRTRESISGKAWIITSPQGDRRAPSPTDSVGPLLAIGRHLLKEDARFVAVTVSFQPASHRIKSSPHRGRATDRVQQRPPSAGLADVPLSHQRGRSSPNRIAARPVGS